MADISEKVAKIRQAILGKEVRESLAAGIEAINSEVEDTTARQAAVEAAEQARQAAEAIRVDNENVRIAEHSQRMAEVDAIADSYDAATKANISVELSNARKNNITSENFENLPARLDTEYQRTASQLAALDAQLADNATLLASKVDKVDGKGLSTNDYTNEDKAEVAKIPYKTDKTYVDTLAASIASGSPKATFATLADLQADATANTTDGKKHIYLVTADGKWYYWSGSAWSAGGTYQSTGLSDGSVTAVKRTQIGDLALITSTGGNVNVDYATKTITIPSTGIIVCRNVRYTNSSGWTISFATQYNGGTVAYVFFNTSDQSFIVVDGSQLATIPETAVLCAIIPINANQLVMNANYTVNGISLLKDGSVTSSKLANGSVTSQKRSVLGEWGLVGSTGGYPNFDFVDCKLIIPPVAIIAWRNKKYTVDAGISIDFSENANAGTTSYIYFNTVTNTFRVVNGGTLNSVTEDEILIAMAGKRIDKVAFMPNAYLINGVSPISSPISNSAPSIYNPPIMPATDGTVDFNAETLQVSDVYAAYDALMSSYPNYVKRTLLGNDASGTLPIYRYDFIPNYTNTIDGNNGTTVNTDSIKPTKIILGSGIHGNGPGGDNTNSILALYYFLKDLCERWREDSLLGYLRWNVHFIVMPVQNPWGVNNLSRYNANNVDINRNFDLNWADTSDPHKGSSAFSEPESQYIRDVINANKDALYYFDIHTRGGSEFPSQQFLAVAPYNSESMRIMQNVTGVLTEIYEGTSSTVNLFENLPTSYLWATNVAGVQGSNPELTYMANSEDTKHSSLATTYNAAYIGNCIWQVVEWFKMRPKIASNGYNGTVLVGDKTFTVRDGIIVNIQ